MAFSLRYNCAINYQLSFYAHVLVLFTLCRFKLFCLCSFALRDAGLYSPGTSQQAAIRPAAWFVVCWGLVLWATHGAAAVPGQRVDRHDEQYHLLELPIPCNLPSPGERFHQKGVPPALCDNALTGVEHFLWWNRLVVCGRELMIISSRMCF